MAQPNAYICTHDIHEYVYVLLCILSIYLSIYITEHLLVHVSERSCVSFHLVVLYITGNFSQQNKRIFF